MKKLTSYLTAVLSCVLLLCPGENRAAAQHKAEKNRAFMEYHVVGNDTIFYDLLQPAKVWERLPRQRGREWRRYYKLVYNFSKVYPYALEAGELIKEVDDKLENGNLSRRKKEKYIDSIQKDLLRRYEPVLREMTVSQGKVLIKLISRETGLTPYEIIHEYKNGIAAGFWQGIAKIFDGDLKVAFDGTRDEDMALEDLARKWADGDFPGFYWSLFGEYPKVPVLPERRK